MQKVCKQCGVLKPLTEYRKYYAGRKGCYKTCKLCDKINSRAKYLTAKGDKRDARETAELDKIHELYDVQRAAGLNPPSVKGKRAPVFEDLDAMISSYSTKATSDQDVTIAPPDLTKWLVCELTEEPDYYLDNIYEGLKTTYRPQVGMNGTMPVYDDKYKPVLDKILNRLYDYEDSYYDKEN